MKKLSTTQLNRASEIIGNVSVAWFSGGIISPLITKSLNYVEYITFFGISLLMSGIFMFFSLQIIKIDKKI